MSKKTHTPTSNYRKIKTVTTTHSLVVTAEDLSMVLSNAFLIKIPPNTDFDFRTGDDGKYEIHYQWDETHEEEE